MLLNYRMYRMYRIVSEQMCCSSGRGHCGSWKPVGTWWDLLKECNRKVCTESSWISVDMFEFWNWNMKQFVSVISKCLVTKTFLWRRYERHMKRHINVKTMIVSYINIQKVGESHFNFFKSLFLSYLSTQSTPLPFSFRKGQVSQGYQQNMTYQVPIKTRRSSILGLNEATQ